MTPTLKVIAAAVVVAAVAVGISNVPRGEPDVTEVVALAAGSFAYRQSGEYLEDGVPVNAPVVDIAFGQPLAIMKRQVSGAEYGQCVAAGACKAVADPPGGGDMLPVVGVSWRDATAYASWLSRQTGYRYRLPSDAEWAYAAGRRFRDPVVVEAAGNSTNPAMRWLAAYENESKTIEPVDPATRLFGSFGVNENGLVDIAGNVWEWTDTCYVRHAHIFGRGRTEVESCGVRVVEGRHRTYISDFVRDPRGGGCSVGTPPNNLGIRLVRDDGTFFERAAFSGAPPYFGKRPILKVRPGLRWINGSPRIATRVNSFDVPS